MVDKTGVRPMHFIGTDNKMSFIAVSHVRIYKDTPESEFAKVAYELVKDEHNEDLQEALLLVKTESPNVWEEDERRDKYRKVYPILHGLKKLKFRYWRKDKPKEFVNTWDSDKEETKNIYPDMIEVTFEVHGPSKLVFDGIYNFRPEVPLSGISPSS
jgi:general secretion pathway protein J